MKNYEFNIRELIETSKTSKDELGHAIYEDLVGIAGRCFFHMPKNEAVYRLSNNLINHMRIHRHNPHSDIVHLSLNINEIKLSPEDSRQFLNEDKTGLVDINAQKFLEAFKIYERKVAESIGGISSEQNWYSMQYVLSLFLKR